MDGLNFRINIACIEIVKIHFPNKKNVVFGKFGKFGKFGFGI